MKGLGLAAALTAMILAVGCGDSDVEVFRGDEHCGWESVDIIRVPAGEAPPVTAGDSIVDFVRDPDGVLPARLVFGEFESPAALPDDARDTGLRTPFGELWLSPTTSDVAFLVSGDDIERWPAAYPGCD